MRNHVTQKGHKWKKKEQMASMDRITHLNYIIKNSYWAQNYIYIREIRIKSVFSFVIIFFLFQLVNSRGILCKYKKNPHILILRKDSKLGAWSSNEFGYHPYCYGCGTKNGIWVPYQESTPRPTNITMLYSTNEQLMCTRQSVQRDHAYTSLVVEHSTAKLEFPIFVSA